MSRTSNYTIEGRRIYSDDLDDPTPEEMDREDLVNMIGEYEQEINKQSKLIDKLDEYLEQIKIACTDSPEDILPLVKKGLETISKRGNDMDYEEMLEELYKEMLYGGPQMTDWEESFITDVYEKVWEDGREMTETQEEKVEEIYDRYLG